jgi:membrane protease YdiL (CAAX protease family)
MLILLFVVHGGMESHSQHYIGEVHFVQDIRFWYVSVFVEIFFHFFFTLFFYQKKKKEKRSLSLMTSIACFFFKIKQIVGDKKGAVFGGLVEAPLQPTDKKKYQVTYHYPFVHS